MQVIIIARCKLHRLGNYSHSRPRLPHVAAESKSWGKPNSHRNRAAALDRLEQTRRLLRKSRERTAILMPCTRPPRPTDSRCPVSHRGEAESWSRRTLSQRPVIVWRQGARSALGADFDSSQRCNVSDLKGQGFLRVRIRGRSIVAPCPQCFCSLFVVFVARITFHGNKL